MSFKYNDVLVAKEFINYEDSDTKNEHELVEKYRKGEYRIVTEQARYPLNDLSTIFKNYELTPDYQRRRVWDIKRKSKLIESFIINVPVPPIFLYEYEFNEYEVMDGLQRISAILEFFSDGYKLEGLDLWSELNGKSYSELPLELQKAINRRYLSAIILLKETAENQSKEKMMKRFVFERLNTGGMALSYQEIRNAMYSSNFNETIIKLAESPLFRQMWGEVEEEGYSRMEDCELVLRFFAYKSASKHNIAKPTRILLDIYAEKAKQFSDDDIIELEELFIKTLEFARKLFGISAFKAIQNSKRSEKMIYDTVMLTCAELIEENKEKRYFEMGSSITENAKYDCISNNRDIFNGKYTSIRNVNERVISLKKTLRGLSNA